MCGICGFFNPERAPDLQKTGANMAAALSHRGPDAGGLWQDPDSGLVLGHRRLSIIDLSPLGAQPMESHSGRYVISYNGEIYNYLALQKELRAAGVAFKGRSDTEVMLAGIEHWGLNLALQKLNGMFALALWDQREKTLHLARDRMGKKPLYFGWAGKNFVFGSELKSLRAHPGFKPVLNKQALAAYLHYAYVPAPMCIYQNVWSLPQGARISLDVAKLQSGENLEKRIEFYCDAARVVEEQRGRRNDEAGALKEFDELLSLAVRERMISDVPLGAFLSGGIDSSLVTALMQENSKQRIKTYTIGFEESGYNEARHAWAVAQHLGTDHHEHIMRPGDALAVIPKLPDIYDEPFADISAIPTFLVSQFARRDITVALSGDGGDELFGGYNRHIVAPALQARMRFLPYPARALLAKAIESLPPSRWDAIKPEHPQFGERMHKIASVLRARGKTDVYENLVAQWETPPVLNENFSPRAYETPPGLNFAEDMMFWDAVSYLPGDILTKVDRASMAVGLEARAPLLDRRVFEFAWSLPLSMKIRDGKGKWILRQSLARRLPEELFERPKQGFAMPVDAWLRGPLRDWAENLLDEKKLREDGVLDPAPIRAAWRAQQSGAGRNAQKLWTVLMFQAWKEHWL